MGTITADTTIVAKFTSDDTSCEISGMVEFEGSPYPSGFVYAISETSHKIVGGANFTDGAFTARIPRDEAVTLVAATSSYAILAGNSNAITSEQTSGATLDITSTPIELLAENPESCWLSGAFTCNGPVKDAAIICLWDEGQSGVYDFHDSIAYTEDTGKFLLKGKHGYNSYILYNGPGIRMSVRRISSILTSLPIYVAS